MIGGWPLFTQTLLTDLDPKKVKIVAVDALPAELAYVEKGLAPVLLAQPTYLWGYVGVNTIFDKVQLKKDVPADHPDGARARDEGQPRHLGAAAERLGIHRRARGVPEIATIAARLARDGCENHHRSMGGRRNTDAIDELSCSRARERALVSARTDATRVQRVASAPGTHSAALRAARTAPNRATTVCDPPSSLPPVNKAALLTIR